MKSTKDDRSISHYVVPVCVMLGLALALVWQSAFTVRYAESSATSQFRAYGSGIEAYRDSLITPWRGRLLANALAAQFVHLGKYLHGHTFRLDNVRGHLELAIGLWTAFWFLLAALLFLIGAKNRSLFYTFGTFAGISFGYASGTVTYPWDLPALFVFTAFVMLFARNKFWWIFAMLPVAVGFKETAAVLTLVFLFGDFPRPRRLLMFAGSAVLCAAVKAAIGLYANSSPLLPMTDGLSLDWLWGSYFLANTLEVFRVYPFFVNGGTLLAFLLLPSPDEKTRALKKIAAVFVLGIFVYGRISEYRIWFEIIPFALYSLSISAYGENVLAAVGSRPVDPASDG